MLPPQNNNNEDTKRRIWTGAAQPIKCTHLKYNKYTIIYNIQAKKWLLWIYEKWKTDKRRSHEIYLALENISWQWTSIHNHGLILYHVWLIILCWWYNSFLEKYYWKKKWYMQNTVNFKVRLESLKNWSVGTYLWIQSLNIWNLKASAKPYNYWTKDTSQHFI